MREHFRTATPTQLRRLTVSAACLALCLVLPLLTAQMQEAGKMLCPMHLPVLLCGFLCGPWWAAAVGVLAPLLRHAVFAMPPYPTAIAMCFELLTYGAVSGVLHRLLPKTRGWLYASLATAMLLGRIVSGAAMLAITAAQGAAYTWQAYFAAHFATALPGIALQLLLIPPIVRAWERTEKGK